MHSISDLPWLPSLAISVKDAFHKFCAEGLGPASAFRKISAHRLNTDQLFYLTKLRDKSAEAFEPVGLTPIKLAILGNATTCLFVPAIPATGFRHGLHITTVQSPYDQVMQEAIDPESQINRCSPDAILIALDHHFFQLRPAITSATDAEMAITDAIEKLTLIITSIRQHSNASIILQTLSDPPIHLFGSSDCKIRGTLVHITNEINTRAIALAESWKCHIFDVHSLASEVGTENWHEPKQWNLYKLPFSQTFVPIYCEQLCRILAAIKGKAKKCIVFDLDNTLWGGIVGDDGLNGIKIGQGSGIGEAHLELQSFALELRNRRIVIAVCSKNDEKNAVEPFHSHPDMLLRREHIASFKANWLDKATNLEAIASELALGLDSFVFIDDNPFEREQVRSALPTVSVPELPEDPSYYSRAISQAGYFESLGITSEDLQRADQYKARAEFISNISTGRDLTQYLASLHVEMSLSPFDDVGVARVTQLINKTNQFNLTTHRYNEDDVRNFQNSPDGYITIQARVKDKQTDHGMVSVVIARIDKTHLYIDTWLMSCRVLGRHIEHALMNSLVELAKDRGVSHIYGEYIPSEKNSMVADLYKNFGFALTSDSDNGHTTWLLDISSYRASEPPVTTIYSIRSK